MDQTDIDRPRLHGDFRDVLAVEAQAVMTPGVLTVSVTASLDQTARALAAHRVHVVFAVDRDGKPAGWVTARVLLRRVGHDRSRAWAFEAITEQMTSVDRHGAFPSRSPARGLHDAKSAPCLVLVVPRGVHSTAAGDDETATAENLRMAAVREGAGVQG